MKRLSHHQRTYLERRSLRVPRHVSLARRRLKIRHRPRKRSQNRVFLKAAPENFRLTDVVCRQGLFSFFDDVDVALALGRNVKLSFKNTRKMFPCGTLVFLARLDLWLAKYPRKITCDYPDDEVVEQLLQHFSVLSKLGLNHRKEINSDRVAYWHFYSGSKADLSGFKDVTLSIIKGIEHPQKELFADCLNEAVVNTVHHAYKSYSEAEMPSGLRRWWILSQFRGDRMYVAIYDVGEGIPGTLKRKPEWLEFFRHRHYNDDRTIESAIVSKRTSTLQPERGQGLPEMLEFSQSLKGGGLSIISSKGAFEYDADNDTPRRRKYSSPLQGTLVQWAIPFRKEQENGNHERINSQTVQ
ncbi:hypothetical protein IFT68_03705 [Oxalobacteraceae sp. CFBP 13730]|nr:hypothetical protein [Oxalobacteraceae sp. CFBP 13730]